MRHLPGQRNNINALTIVQGEIEENKQFAYFHFCSLMATVWQRGQTL